MAFGATKTARSASSPPGMPLTRTLSRPHHLSHIYGSLGNANWALESQGVRNLSWVVAQSVYRASRTTAHRSAIPVIE